jgi:hypothetical protein
MFFAGEIKSYASLAVPSAKNGLNYLNQMTNSSVKQVENFNLKILDVGK